MRLSYHMTEGRLTAQAVRFMAHACRGLRLVEMQGHPKITAAGVEFLLTTCTEMRHIPLNLVAGSYERGIIRMKNIRPSLLVYNAVYDERRHRSELTPVFVAYPLIAVLHPYYAILDPVDDIGCTNEVEGRQFLACALYSQPSWRGRSLLVCCR